MAKHSRFALLFGVALAITLVISACGGDTTGSGSGSSAAALTPGTFTCVTGAITASGSSALAPLAKEVATKYEGKCSGATITVNLGGSKTGLAQVASGAVNIGNSDVPADPSTQSNLVEHQVSIITFVMIVNKDVGLKNLTTVQIQDIYSGKTTNWNQIGGPNIPIVVVSRPASSGTRATFTKYILKGPETVTGPSSLSSDSTGQVITNVAQTPGAIGYAAKGPADKESGLIVTSIDGVAPTIQDVTTNKYVFWNIERMYTNGPATGLSQAYIYYMTSPEAEDIGKSLEFVPITQMQPEALSAHLAVK